MEKIVQGSDDYGNPVRIALLGDLKIIDELADNFRNGIYERAIEKRFDITIDVIGLTLADLEIGSEISAGDMILLWGGSSLGLLDKQKR